MLYTHGSTLLSRPQLHEVPVPERTDVSPLWKGLNHGVLADTIIQQIEKVGLEVKQEMWYCNPKQTALFGAVDILAESVPGVKLDIGQDACFSLGVRHGNDGQYAVSFAVGGRVFVCSNGMFSGDFVLKHRHMRSLDLDEAVSDGIKKYINECGALEAFVNGMREVPLDNKDASYLIMRTAERLPGNEQSGCLNWAHLRDIYENWIKPPHEEFSPRTQWSLYNAFTEVGKTLSPPRQMTMLKGLRPLMEEFGRN